MNEQKGTSASPTTIAAYVLFAFTAVMGAVAGWYFYKAYGAEGTERTKHFPLLFWGVANAVVGLSAALWALTYKPPLDARGEETSPLRLVALAVGGLLGFTTVICLGLGYTWLWWDQLTKSRAAWGEMKTWVPALIILGGLAVMLLSVLSVRSEERKNALLRRVVYGYNAVLVGLLVFAILGVGNVMASIYAVRPLDWTETSIYSVTDQTKRVLEGLEAPVDIYVFTHQRDPLFQDLKTLLDSYGTYSDQITVEYVVSQQRYATLFKEYELLDNTHALVVYDAKGASGKPLFQVISGDDLEDAQARMQSQSQQRNFKGEQAITSAINSLRDGKVNFTIYFTQDSGEMKLSEFGGRRERRGQLDRGLGGLKRKLESKNYTVKELDLGAIDPATRAPIKVPDDALAVVMPGPTELGEPAVAQTKIKTLEEYMQRPKAKMIVLLDAVRNRDGEVQLTGLEGFLSRYGVQVGKDMILHPALRTAPDPTVAVVWLSMQSDPAFVETFQRRVPLPFYEARSIQPAPQAAQHAVSKLLETYPLVQGFTGQWAEDKLRGDPEKFVENMKEKDPEGLDRLMRTPPISVAVTVRDKSADSGMPDDMAHRRARQSADGAPRMVVFGSSTMLSNTAIEGGREDYFNFFVSSLAWLRDRTEVMAEIQPKERKAYRMNLKPDDRDRMFWMPGLVLLVGVIGCGVGMWFLRRQ